MYSLCEAFGARCRMGDVNHQFFYGGDTQVQVQDCSL